MLWGSDLNSLPMTVTREVSDRLTISVVSHGHSALILSLAKQLASNPLHRNIRLVVTINSPELDDALDANGLALTSLTNLVLLKNTTSKGFGANHNQAFQKCETEFFCIVNPDIELTKEPFANLLNALSVSGVGVTYPRQVDGGNSSLDFERELASPTSIAQRHLFRQRHQSNLGKLVHWVSGSFLMFKSSVFRELGGFDERYFMYCEDVDICLRLQLAGYKLARADATVIHHTQRQTLKNPKHLAWHIRSLLRLWNSAAYKEYKRKFIDSRR
jgi:N-acetylglucosaminyl-diphospho-decaprenol L-rhamnosyltransferase